jgi:hypothetical protein
MRHTFPSPREDVNVPGKPGMGSFDTFPGYPRRAPMRLELHSLTSLEESVLLRGGQVVGRGRTERDFLYVLMLH